MPERDWLAGTSPAFRLMIATSWLAPDGWQERQDQAIREAVAAGPDWEEFRSLVGRHETPALSRAALNRVPGTSIPEPIGQQLRKLSDACRMQAMQYCLLLTDLLREFNLASIPVMPLKGPLLSYELYGDIGLRHSRDLDLEIAREDLEGARSCLERKNWHLDSSFFPMTPRQWESVIRIEHHLNFKHSPSGRTLELHWRNHWETAEATSARWNRSIASVWQGCSIQTMNPADRTLYLCSHGGIHAWFRAKWIGDLARAHAVGRLDWKAALEEALRSGQANVVLTGLCILREVYGLPLPELPSPRNTWPGVSLQLMEATLQSLEDPLKPPHGTRLPSTRISLYLSRYERWLWPRRTWGIRLATLLHRRDDFRVLHLPDGLFWLYKPLRPVLWAWRWIRQFRRQPREQNSLQVN